jgi:hypothetical protein
MNGLTVSASAACATSAGVPTRPAAAPPCVQPGGLGVPAIVSQIATHPRGRSGRQSGDTRGERERAGHRRVPGYQQRAVQNCTRAAALSVQPAWPTIRADCDLWPASNCGRLSRPRSALPVHSAITAEELPPRSPERHTLAWTRPALAVHCKLTATCCSARATTAPSACTPLTSSDGSTLTAVAASSAPRQNHRTGGALVSPVRAAALLGHRVAQWHLVPLGRLGRLIRRGACTSAFRRRPGTALVPRAESRAVRLDLRRQAGPAPDKGLGGAAGDWLVTLVQANPAYQAARTR